MSHVGRRCIQSQVQQDAMPAVAVQSGAFRDPDKHQRTGARQAAAACSECLARWRPALDDADAIPERYSNSGHAAVTLHVLVEVADGSGCLVLDVPRGICATLQQPTHPLASGFKSHKTRR